MSPFSVKVAPVSGRLLLMLESLLFMLFLFIGGLGLAFSLICALVGWITGSRAARELAVGFLLIPLGSWGAIALWYIVVVPLLS